MMTEIGGDDVPRPGSERKVKSLMCGKDLELAEPLHSDSDSRDLLY